MCTLIAIAILLVTLRTVHGEGEGDTNNFKASDFQIDEKTPIILSQRLTLHEAVTSLSATSINKMNEKLQRILNWMENDGKFDEGGKKKLAEDMTNDGSKKKLGEEGETMDEGSSNKTDDEGYKIPPGEWRNCAELRAQGDNVSGVRIVYPSSLTKGISVFCDQTTDGGGYTLIQRRDVIKPREDFYRNWADYKTGFGNLTGEFWLGLDNIHALVSETPMEARFNLEDFDNKYVYAAYNSFKIENEAGKYRVNAGGYSGTAGDGFNIQNGHAFSTKDRDNDIWANNCAISYRGAWWYSNCHHTNLNGFQHEREHASFADGINWYQFRGYYYSLKKTSIGVRPKTKKN